MQYVITSEGVIDFDYKQSWNLRGKYFQITSTKGKGKKRAPIKDEKWRYKS